MLVCGHDDDLKAKGLADEEGSRTYGFPDGLANGDVLSRYRTARDKEHTDERRQVGEWARVARKRTLTNGEKKARSCLPFGEAALTSRVFIHQVRAVETIYATQRQ